MPDASRCDATSKQTGQRCKRTPSPGLSKCSIHCGLTAEERHGAADEARLMEQAGRELAKLDVVPVVNSLAELRWLAGVAHAWLQTAADLVNQLTPDTLRYEGRLRGEQLRSEISLLERSMERCADVNTKIARLGIDERLTAIKERDFTDLLAAFKAAARDTGHTPAETAALQASFATHIQAIHQRRKVEPSPITIPGHVIAE